MAVRRLPRRRPLARIAGALLVCAATGGLLGVGIHRLAAPPPAAPPVEPAGPAVTVAALPPLAQSQPPSVPVSAPAPAPVPDTAQAPAGGGAVGTQTVVSPLPKAAPTPAPAPVPALASVSCPDGALPTGPAPRCHVLRAPSDWRRPDSPPLDLFVMVLPARGEAAADPVVVLNGGPGQGGSDDPRGAAAILEPMRAGRDLILVDQRGTGRSVPSLRCPALDPLRYWFGGVTAADADACLAPVRRAGYRLEDFDTAQSAADLRALRDALGIARWNVVATSYGGVLAQALLRVDGAAVRSLVLNSPATPEATWLDLDRLAGIRQAHRRMVEDCAAQPACARAFPTLPGAVERLAAALERQPLSLRLRHPGSGAAVDLRLTWPMLASVVALRLGSADGMVPVPALLDHLDRRLAERRAAGQSAPLPVPLEDPAVTALVMPPMFWRALDTLAYGLNLTIGCRENRPHVDAAAARRAASDLRPHVVADAVETDYDAACPALGLPPVEAAFYRPVESDVPTLVLSGAYDTLTAPARVESLGRTLRRAVVLPFRGLGHDVLGASACGRAAAARFVERLAAEEAGNCMERFLPPTFVTAVPDRLLRP